MTFDTPVLAQAEAYQSLSSFSNFSMKIAEMLTLPCPEGRRGCTPAREQGAEHPWKFHQGSCPSKTENKSGNMMGFCYNANLPSRDMPPRSPEQGVPKARAPEKRPLLTPLGAEASHQPHLDSKPTHAPL